VRQWQQSQATLASGYVREWPHYEALKRSVRHLKVPRPTEVPRYAGGSWFRTVVPEGGVQAQVVMADSPSGEGRVLFDPKPLSAVPRRFWSASGRKRDMVGLRHRMSSSNRTPIGWPSSCGKWICVPARTLERRTRGGERRPPVPAVQTVYHDPVKNRPH
jgi:hypothetical protein